MENLFHRSTTIGAAIALAPLNISNRFFGYFNSGLADSALVFVQASLNSIFLGPILLVEAIVISIFLTPDHQTKQMFLAGFGSVSHNFLRIAGSPFFVPFGGVHRNDYSVIGG